MAILNQTQIATLIQQYAGTQFAFIDTTTGRPFSSLFLNAFASEIATAYAALQQVQTDQGVSNPASATSDGMAGVAFNWTLTPKNPVASTTVLTFQKIAQPTTNIQIGNSDGSGGMIIATSRQVTGTVVLFVTTETVFLSPTTVINPATGFYEVDAECQCLSLGTVGNVDAGLINVLQTPVAGIDFVTNKISATGGQDSENTVALASRIVAKSTGLQPGTVNGLVSAALLQPNTISAVVVGPNDAYFTRSGVAGAVDVLVLGGQLTSTTQYDTYTTNQPSVLLQDRPALAIASVVATVGLTLTTLVPGADYVFSQDTGSSNAYSSSSNDQLSWLNGSQPNNNSPVTITYLYDAAIGAAQAALTTPTTEFITANVLVKRAVQVTVNMSLTVRQVAGYSVSVVTNNVAAAISDLVNNLGLGQPVTQSALTVAITSATGVASVVLPFTSLYVRGQTPSVGDIYPTKYTYCRVDTQSLTVNVVSS